MPPHLHPRRLLALGLLVFAPIFSGAVFAQGAVAGDNTYHVNPGDQLEVSVWGEENLQRAVLVRPDGGFSFPLAGDVQASGRSIEVIREELTSKLSRYIPNAVVTVMVTAIGGNIIYVIGQVNNPGSFVMNPRIDVMQALSVAGGTTAFANLDNIRILRRNESGQVVHEFRYNDVAKGRGLEQNILLESGDVVVVP